MFKITRVNSNLLFIHYVLYQTPCMVSTEYATPLTHWGRMTHICIGKLIIIGSDNGLSPGRRQAIIWTNAGILLTGPLGTNSSEILKETQIISLNKIHLKMSSAKCCPFCLGLNVLKCRIFITIFHNRELHTDSKECIAFRTLPWKHMVYLNQATMG